MLKKWVVIGVMAAGGPIHAQRIFDVKKFGALGDGNTNNAWAIQKAIDTCSANGGGIVVVPAPYTFVSGPIELKSNIDLRVEKCSF